MIKKFTYFIYKTLNNTLGAFLEINLFKKKFFFKDYFSLNNKLNNTTMEKYTFLQSLPRVFFELIGVSILILLFLYYQSIPDISIQSILPKMSLFVFFVDLCVWQQIISKCFFEGCLIFCVFC